MPVHIINKHLKHHHHVTLITLFYIIGQLSIYYLTFWIFFGTYIINLNFRSIYFYLHLVPFIIITIIIIFIIIILHDSCTHITLILHSLHSLILHSYCTHLTLILHSKYTHIINVTHIILHVLLILHSYYIHIVLVLLSYYTHISLILHSYYTHIHSSKLHSYCTHIALISHLLLFLF
jgi:hypothetical protein